MQPIQKILAPTDFSPHSEYALQYAADLAQRYDAPLSLVHVYPVVNYAAAEGFALYTPEQLTTLLHQLGKQLQAAEAAARAAGATRVDGTLVQGDAYQELLALSSSFDLIVMGTHGRTGLRHALMGSVAEKLVRTAICPVFTVRKPADAAGSASRS